MTTPWIHNRESNTVQCSQCGIRHSALLKQCPQCGQLIEVTTQGVEKIGNNLWRCLRCMLEFGKVLKKNEEVRCPVCPSQPEKGAQ